MSTTEEILAAIDAAVEDWTVSGDAMRCNASPGAMMVPTGDYSPGGIVWSDGTVRDHGTVRVAFVPHVADLHAPTLTELTAAGGAITLTWIE